MRKHTYGFTINTPRPPPHTTAVSSPRENIKYLAYPSRAVTPVEYALNFHDLVTNLGGRQLVSRSRSEINAIEITFARYVYPGVR